jgi:hypothetical protein
MKSFNRRAIAVKKHEIELHEIAIDDLKTHKTPLADLLAKQKEIDIQILRLEIQNIIELDEMSDYKYDRYGNRIHSDSDSSSST